MSGTIYTSFTTIYIFFEFILHLDSGPKSSQFCIDDPITEQLFCTSWFFNYS